MVLVEGAERIWNTLRMETAAQSKGSVMGEQGRAIRLRGMLSTSLLPCSVRGEESEEFNKLVPFVFLPIPAGRWP